MGRKPVRPLSASHARHGESEPASGHGGIESDAFDGRGEFLRREERRVEPDEALARDHRLSAKRGAVELAADEHPARSEDAGSLGERSGLVGDVMERVHDDHRIDSPIGEWQRRGVGPDALDSLSGGLPEHPGGGVDDDSLGGVESARRSARAATDVEDALDVAFAERETSTKGALVSRGHEPPVEARESVEERHVARRVHTRREGWPPFKSSGAGAIPPRRRTVAMEYAVCGWPAEGPTLELDWRRFSYAGKFVMSNTGKAVARENGEIVAAVAFNEDRTDSQALWLRYITVREDRRGEGIGARLAAFVTERALARGYERLRIAVNNPFAYEALYKAGFGYTGRETGLAELVLERPAERSREAYQAGLDVYRERDLSETEREFLDSRSGAGPPVVVKAPE